MPIIHITPKLDRFSAKNIRKQNDKLKKSTHGILHCCEQFSVIRTKWITTTKEIHHNFIFWLYLCNTLFINQSINQSII